MSPLKAENHCSLFVKPVLKRLFLNSQNRVFIGKKNRFSLVSNRPGESKREASKGGQGTGSSQGGEDKVLSSQVSGAGLPSCLSPLHRPRAAWERRRLRRLVHILTGVTAVPCWIQRQEWEGLDGWAEGERGGGVRLVHPESQNWCGLLGLGSAFTVTAAGHRRPRKLPAFLRLCGSPRCTTCPSCPLTNPSRASVPTLLLPTVLTSRLPYPCPQQMAPLHTPLIPGTHQWRTPHLSVLEILSASERQANI